MISTLPGPPGYPETDEDDDEEEECDTGNCSVGISSGIYTLITTQTWIALHLIQQRTVYKYIPVRIKVKPRTSKVCIFLLYVIWHRRWDISRLRCRCRAEIQCSNGEIGRSLTTGVYYPNISVLHKFNGVFTQPTLWRACLSPTNVSCQTSSLGIKDRKGLLYKQHRQSFGAGWMLSGYERLHINPDGNILLTDGM